MSDAAQLPNVSPRRSGPARNSEGGTRQVPYKQWSDGALADAVTDRDEVAYTEICRRHSTALRAVAAMILGRSPECDDVVADVLVAFWVGPELFEPSRGPLLGYLRLHARSRSIDLLRSESSRHRREQTDALSQRPAESDIDAVLLAEEAGAELERALALLPEKEREPIRLAFYNAMSYRVVAGHLNIPEGTVKSRIRTGLRRLRDTVQDEYRYTTMATRADELPTSSMSAGEKGVT